MIRDTCAPEEIGMGIGLYSLAPLLGPGMSTFLKGMCLSHGHSLDLRIGLMFPWLLLFSRRAAHRWLYC